MRRLPSRLRVADDSKAAIIKDTGMLPRVNVRGVWIRDWKALRKLEAEQRSALRLLSRRNTADTSAEMDNNRSNRCHEGKLKAKLAPLNHSGVAANVSNMKKLFLLFAVCSLCGCAHQYVMRLSNGMTISTPSKPKLRGSNYYFKDAHGDEQSIPQTRVTEIAPASMAAEENKFQTSQPKKKHWYWPF